MALGDHFLRFQTTVPRPRAEVFEFFAAAEKLEVLTPPELRFKILTPLPISMGVGTTILYQLRLFGIPFSWTTLISDWEPGWRFVDEQLKGPYRVWVHTHTFSDADGGTLVSDEVRYRLPLYPFGEVAYPLVRRQLQRIFQYRRETLLDLLRAR